MSGGKKPARRGAKPGGKGPAKSAGKKKRRGPGPKRPPEGGRRGSSDQRSAMPGDADERAALEGTGLDGPKGRTSGGRGGGRGP
ncbi:MAG: hypothetical protein WC558_04860, partial [Patulibacter sp.]